MHTRARVRQEVIGMLPYLVLTISLSAMQPCTSRAVPLKVLKHTEPKFPGHGDS